jgi:hypothetical protein
LILRSAATVCIPWRPSPSRIPIFERIYGFWEQTGWPIITADSDTEIFSAAQARNNAVSQAKTDVVVLSDADSICEIHNVMAAVAEPSGVHWPFDSYRLMTKKQLDVPFDELPGIPWINLWGGDGSAGVGGCMVIRRDLYWQLGGQPPEFIGWGWEDVAFTAIANTLSTIKRSKGFLFAFEHNVTDEGVVYANGQADSPGWNRDIERNRELMAPYKNANGRPWLMREILRRRQIGVRTPYVGFGAENIPMGV